MIFSEDSRVKIPTILHLTRLGYKYLSLKDNTWNLDTNIFTDIFIKSITAINNDVSEEDAKRVLDEVSLSLDNEDLGKAFYKKLTQKSGVKLIDFENFENNTFNVVTELTYKKDEDEFRPDVILLINGMPLVFIEVKKPNNKDGVLAERKRIDTRFQNKKFKKFVNITQLMVFSNNMEYNDSSPLPIEGAFTGAEIDKKGILSKYKNGGILFLDEIQDLSKPLQRQLIQVLQTGEYHPLGASEPEKAIFKLIIASNIPFNKLSNDKLDSDFLDRTARFIVEIPPLRLCKDDLELYWKAVWKEVANFEDAPTIIWNKKIHHFLLNKELNGNFRDLQKLASYIIAFHYEYKKTDIAINKAIDEFNKWNNQLSKKRETHFVKNKTYNEIIAIFNKELAEWAIKEYRTKQNASKVLNRSKSMLSKDLSMDRLNK